MSHLLIISINLNDIAILNIKGSDYRCIISLISKNVAINLMQNVDLTEKSGTFKLENLKWNIKIFESMYINGKYNYKIW